MTWNGTVDRPRPTAPTAPTVVALRVVAVARVVLATLAIVVTALYLGDMWLDTGGYVAQLTGNGVPDLFGDVYPAVTPTAVTGGLVVLVAWAVGALIALGPRRRGAAAVGVLSALCVLGAVVTAVVTVFSSWYRLTESGPLLLVGVSLLFALADVVVVGLLLTPSRRAWSRAARPGPRVGPPPPGAFDGARAH